MTAGLWFTLAAVFVVLGALASAMHMALRESSRARLVELARLKKRESLRRRVDTIVADVGGHASAVGLPRIVCNVVVVLCLVLWSAGMRGVEQATWVDGAVGLLVSAAGLWVFGLVLPVALADHAAERTVVVTSRLIRGCHALTRPLLALARFLDEVVRRLAGPDPDGLGEGLEGELLSAVEESEREGQIDEAERDMIEAVVEFRSTTVAQIMTPRTEIEAIEYTDDRHAVETLVESYGHSRIPVFEQNMDRIVGFLYAKDLLHWIINHGNNGTRFVLRELVRPATFVPETKTVRELMAELLGKQVHIAMVADEYGGTSGLVTFEDIVEEIFGEIQDEYEQPEDELIVAIDTEARTLEADARAHIDDLNDELERIDAELPESGDYDTLGGFVTHKLGRIPETGASLRADGVELTVLEAEPTRVVRVLLRALSDDELSRPESFEAAGEDGQASQTGS